MLLTNDASDRITAVNSAIASGKNVFALKACGYYQYSMFFPTAAAAEQFKTEFAANNVSAYDEIVEVTPARYAEITTKMLNA